MLVDSASNNGRLDTESKTTAIILSLFAGLVIYSIYTTSIYQRIREYGVLRAIGATNFKVFLLMIYELLTLSIVSIPIGIILGVGGAQLFNKFAGNIQFEGPVKRNSVCHTYSSYFIIYYMYTISNVYYKHTNLYENKKNITN
ncbi:FtsX-like permease family protein [Paraclostridium bifermentans]|uniref:FtsX-like permease family protein n=1 Tax=Paraclostridium bifermentans TaxID=1490 RepID=A0ABY8R1I9_PARBF|nr:FtsX-like permease family protein [Paraclostridium bifermentans]